MNNYSINDRIERWYEEDVSNNHLEGFFSNYILEFWDHLTLIDILLLAKSCKNIAYQAYYHNIKDFRTFCNQTWVTKTLDLSELPQTSISIETIFRMFPFEKIILPNRIPFDLLTHLPNVEDFTFNFNNETPTLIRPPYKMGNVLTKPNIRINSNCLCKLNDPTNDILFCFSKVNKLELVNTHFQTMTIAAISTINMQKLILKNCQLSQSLVKIFFSALLKSKKTLTHLEIDLCCEHNYTNIVQNMNKEIRRFPLLTTYKITIDNIESNINSLKKLRHSKSLKFLHIVETIGQQAEENRYENIKTQLSLQSVDILFEQKTL